MRANTLSKKTGLVLLFLFQVTGIAFLSICAETPSQASDYSEKVLLKLGSWRTEDIKQMNTFIGDFNKAHPEIRIVFDPTPAAEYDAVLKAQLEGGTAPDLFYLRSFSVSRKLYEAGYLEPLNQVDELRINFDQTMTIPWTSDTGVVFGLPFIATSHGIYYNKHIFEQQGLALPDTWEDLLEICRRLKASHIIPFANAAGDSWTINEIVFFNIAPNFIGGRPGRMAYVTGKRCFNDENMIHALTAVKDISPFLPGNHNLLRYIDSLQLFSQGKSAMWFGGSWDIPYFMSESPDFDWSVFAPPPPKGKPPFITFHLDAGIGVNAETRNKAAALTFIKWAATPEAGRLLGNLLPGFFPMHRTRPVLNNTYANHFLSLNNGRGTDIRLAWEKLREGSPDGYTLMMNAAVAVLNGDQSPQEAADDIQAGLSKWYKPAQTCGK